MEPTPDQLDDGDTPVGSLAKLEEIIAESRVIVPLTVEQVDERYTILDGHRRLRVARALGSTTVPRVVISLTPEEMLSPRETLTTLFVRWLRRVFEGVLRLSGVGDRNLQ